MASLNLFSGYVQVKVDNVPPAKLRKALNGKAVRLTSGDFSGNRVMMVHPLNAKKIKAAQKTGQGLTTNFSHGEAAADLHYHDHVGADFWADRCGPG